MSITSRFAAGLSIVLFAGTLSAGEVVVKGVHLCCGACVKGVNKVLPDAEVDRNAETVTITAADKAAAEKAIAALTGAGFGGTATFDGKPLPLPPAGVEEGATSDKVVFTGVHLCCGGCVKAAEKALADVGDVSVDRKAKTVTVTGEKISHEKAYAALVGSGFYGKIAK